MEARVTLPLDDVERLTRLDDWGVDVAPGDPYQPPEIRGLVLWGVVTGHPRKADGTRVTTSRIVAAEGRVVTTSSGTKYRLGRVSRRYARWCRDKGIRLDRRQPVRVRGRS